MVSEKAINIVFSLALVSFAASGVIWDEPYFVTLTTKIFILGMAGVGLNLALGYGGLVSFGHAAFFGVGGYVSGILASHALNYEPLLTWPIEVPGTTQALIIWPSAILVCSVLAFVIGALSLRTSGVYFIMITLAFAQMLYYFAISWPAYGGEDGLPVYTRNVLPGINTMNGFSFLVVCAILFFGAIVLVSTLVNSRFGLALQAARQNMRRVASLGISTFKVRLIAFVISGAVTGLAGALYTDLNRFVSPSVLSWHTSGEIMVFVIIGGVARLFGPLVGAVIFIALEQFMGGITENWQFWLGLMLVLLVLYARGGVIGVVAERLGPRHA